MHFSIRLKDKYPAQNNQNKKLTQRFTDIVIDSKDSNVLRYKHKGSKNLPYVARIEYYFEFEKSDINIKYIDVILYRMPEYLDADAIIEELITGLYEEFGKMEIFEYFSDETIKLSKKEEVEKVAYRVSMSHKSELEVREELVEKITAQKSLSKINKMIEEFTDSFKILLLTDFLYVEAQGEKPNKALTEEVADEVFKLVNRKKGDARTFLLFKVMIGVKNCYTLLFNALTHKFYLNKYSVELGKIEDPSDEIGQLLYGEFVSACTAHMISGSGPIIEALIESSEEVKGLLTPEMKAMYHYFKTGNPKESLQIYNSEEKNLKDVRKKYEAVCGSRNLVKSFRTSLRNTYIQQLNYLDKLRFGIFNLKYLPEGGWSILIASVVSLGFLSIFLVSLFGLSAKYSHSQDIAYLFKEINGDAITGYIFLSIILIFPVTWIFMVFVLFFRRKIQEASSQTKSIWLVGSVLFSIFTGAIISLYFFFIFFVFRGLATEGVIYAVGEESFYLGFEELEYKEMEKIRFNKLDCEGNCLLVEAVFYMKDGDKEDIKLFVMKDQDPCIPVGNLYYAAKAKDIEIEVEKELKPVLLTGGCRLDVQED